MTSVTDAEAYEAVAERFVDQWGSTTPIVLGSESVSENDYRTTGYVRLSMRIVSRSQATLGPEGGRKYDNRHSIYVQVFVPAAESGGDKRLIELGQQARNVFEGKRFSGIVCDDGEVTHLGTDGMWLMALARVFATFEEVK